MSKLLSDERSLLRYYAESERLLHGPERGAVHQHLLRMGYIEEQPVNLQNAMVVLTQAGRDSLAQTSSGSEVLRRVTWVAAIASRLRLL